MVDPERHAEPILAGLLVAFTGLVVLVLLANDALRRWAARRSGQTRALARPSHPRLLRGLAGVSRMLRRLAPIAWAGAALSFVVHMAYFAHLHYPDDRRVPTETRTVRSLNHGKPAYLTSREAELYELSTALLFFVFGPAAMVSTVTAGWLDDFLKMEGGGEAGDG